MKQRACLITLEVSDLGRARRCDDWTLTEGGDVRLS
jgi:hypothetical protein